MRLLHLLRRCSKSTLLTFFPHRRSPDQYTSSSFLTAATSYSFNAHSTLATISSIKSVFQYVSSTLLLPLPPFFLFFPGLVLPLAHLYNFPPLRVHRLLSVSVYLFSTSGSPFSPLAERSRNLPSPRSVIPSVVLKRTPSASSCTPSATSSSPQRPASTPTPSETVSTSSGLLDSSCFRTSLLRTALRSRIDYFGPSSRPSLASVSFFQVFRTKN